MGKRKIHTTTFYQCDWTGYPLRQAFCFMPTWTPTGKFAKRGCYCNWEAVVAHANYMHEQEDPQMTDETLAKTLEWINAHCGMTVPSSPSFWDLSHTKGRLTMHEFHERCTFRSDPISAVKIVPGGDVYELLLSPNQITGKFGFEPYLHSPYNTLIEPVSFRSMRRKTCDRDLVVWYYNTKELPYNKSASDMFKMQLYGDVLLVQQSREATFLPRDRYVSFTFKQYQEHFQRKRKRVVDCQSLTAAAYIETKRQMQDALNGFEAKAAEAAVRPAEMQRCKKKSRAPVVAQPIPKQEVAPPPQVLEAW